LNKRGRSVSSELDIEEKDTAISTPASRVEIPREYSACVITGKHITVYFVYVVNRILPAIIITQMSFMTHLRVQSKKSQVGHVRSPSAKKGETHTQEVELMYMAVVCEKGPIMLQEMSWVVA
jgi:hypothetical protein